MGIVQASARWSSASPMTRAWPGRSRRNWKAQGAEVALTYQGEVLEKRVRPLAEQIGRARDRRARRHRRRANRITMSERARAWGGLDMLVHAVAFAEREDLRDRFLTVSRENFAKSLEISAYSLVALARAAEPLMEARGGGSILTLSYLGAVRAVPNYNVMGVAKAALEACVRYLAVDLGTEKYPRQRDQRRARAHALVLGHPRLSFNGARGRGALAAAPRDEDRGGRQDGGRDAERPFQRRHRPDRLRRRRLQYHRRRVHRPAKQRVARWRLSQCRSSSDNYAYLVIDDASKECGVVDCAEADKVLAAVNRHGLKLVAVLTTHWHGDHVGGNQDIACERCRGSSLRRERRGRTNSGADESGGGRRRGRESARLAGA